MSSGREGVDDKNVFFWIYFIIGDILVELENIMYYPFLVIYWLRKTGNLHQFVLMLVASVRKHDLRVHLAGQTSKCSISF